MARPPQRLGRPRLDIPEGRRFRGADARSGTAADPVGPALRRPHRVRANSSASRFWPSRSGWRSAQRSSSAFRLRSEPLRRHDPGGVALEPPGGERDTAAAGRLCSPVLRLGRHAVRSDHLAPGAPAGPRHRAYHRRLGKSLAALLIVLAFRYPLSIALTISASLAQIGEFSFILAGLGVGLALLPDQGKDLILAGALISLMLNPLLFVALDRLGPWLTDRERRPAAVAERGSFQFRWGRNRLRTCPGRNSRTMRCSSVRPVGRHIAADLQGTRIPFCNQVAVRKCRRCTTKVWRSSSVEPPIADCSKRRIWRARVGSSAPSPIPSRQAH